MEKIKITSAWKFIIYCLTIVGLVQLLDLSYYLLNIKDDYVANLGILILTLNTTAIIYCFYNLFKSGAKVIKELDNN